MKSKKLKIGIITFWWTTDNYGQLLQCYALQKYLRNLGHDAYLIRYDNRNDYNYIKSPLFIKVLKAFNPVLLYRYLKHKIDSKKSIKETNLHNRHFEDFRNKYIVQSEKIYKSYAELKENPPEADVYIVGSDQIWNFSFYKNVFQCKNLIHAYFLDFGKIQTKRISYAASWSCSNLHLDIIEEIRPLIKNFNYVSVREKNGIELCKKCGYKNAKFAPDPTLLLCAQDYRKIYQENNIRENNKPYILLYMLNNKCNFNINRIYKFAKEKKLEVLYVTGNSKNDKYKKTFATIPEWLYLVDNAEYVITNSFHCCVFSLIFKKKLGIIPLTHKFSQMNERIHNLLSIFEIKSRFIHNNDFSNIIISPDNSPQIKFDIESVLYE